MGLRDNDSGYTSEETFGGPKSDDDSLGFGQPVKTAAPSHGGSSAAFSEDVLKIEICGPSVDYLTVIDVPGIFQTPIKGVTTHKDIEMVRNMVRWYIQDSRTVILAVLPSNGDISNQGILNMADEYDKTGERTLGILTKPDLVTELSVKLSVCNIVRGKKKPLTLGYFLVRSRGADQDDSEFGRREDLFKEEPWCSLPHDRVGVRALKARLAELLGHMACREFPKLRGEIGVMLQSAEKDREALGLSRTDAHGQRLFLNGIAKQFEDRVSQALEAQYAGDKVFKPSMQVSLVTQVVNLAQAFSKEFKDKAILRRFAVAGDETKEIGENEEDANSILMFADDIDPEDFPDLANIISHEFDVSEPEDGTLDWISSVYMWSRGMDLCTPSSAVWTGAWRDQSSKWPSMSKAFMSRVIVAIHRFITAALRDVCKDAEVREKLMSAILDELLRRYQAGMEAAEFLVAAERDTKPYTLDCRFNKRRQRARGERIAARLEPISIVDALSRQSVTITRVRDVTEQKPSIEDMVEQLHDDLSAYYDIAQTRFVDNVLNQAVNYRLLFGPSTPLGVFSREWVVGLRPDQLDAIAGESPGTREQREHLNRKIADLTAAKEILLRS